MDRRSLLAIVLSTVVAFVLTAAELPGAPRGEGAA